MNLENCEAKEAKEFVNEVKRRFIQDNRRDKYDDFLQVLYDYGKQRIDAANLGIIIKGLFEGDRDLISRLNYFMPDGFEIKLPSEEEESREHYEARKAKNFVDEVKRRFIQVNHRDKYDNFVNVLKDYKTQRIDAPNFVKIMMEIFQGHRDLISRLNYFMPDGFEIKLPSEEEESLEHYEARKAKDFVDEVKLRFIQVNHRDKYDNFVNVLKDYKTQRIDAPNFVKIMMEIFQGHRDLISRLNYFMPEGFEIKLPSEEEESLEHYEARKAKDFVDEVKLRFIQVNHRDKYDNFVNVLKDYKTQRIDAPNLVKIMMEIFQGHSDLISRLNYFLPDEYEIKLPLEEE